VPQLMIDIGFLRGNFIENTLGSTSGEDYSRDYDAKLFVLSLCNLMRQFL
jgi:hypothetical protein